MSHARCWGKSIGGRGNGKCDSLEAGVGVQRGSRGPAWLECSEQGRVGGDAQPVSEGSGGPCSGSGFN